MDVMIGGAGGVGRAAVATSSPLRFATKALGIPSSVLVNFTLICKVSVIIPELVDTLVPVLIEFVEEPFKNAVPELVVVAAEA